MVIISDDFTRLFLRQSGIKAKENDSGADNGPSSLEGIEL